MQQIATGVPTSPFKDAEIQMFILLIRSCTAPVNVDRDNRNRVSTVRHKGGYGW